ncbi:hypothetical protein GQ457_06G026530 [Hibiscus cannabinus]
MLILHLKVCILLLILISANSIRDYLLPAIQNLLPHKEALEIILKERLGGTLDALSKLMGAHIGIASSMTSFFGEGGLLGKKENTAPPIPARAASTYPLGPEDTRFMHNHEGHRQALRQSKDSRRNSPPEPEKTSETGSLILIAY